MIQTLRRWPRRAQIAAGALTIAVVASVAVTVPILANRKPDGVGRALTDESPQSPTNSRVRVNQIGYLPTGPKRATLVTEATDPVAWQVRDAGGRTVAKGTSTPHGVDPTSGQRVHSIDFSSVTAPGRSYTVSADGDTSARFPIGFDGYERLRADSLSFYYPQRSGTPILDRIAPGYARAAGHLGVAPNTGDVSVPCQPGTCDYRLDVRGGWYDAGDHGKYVVNGGIAVAQLMSLYERDRSAVSLRIPERDNKTPDVLDEARWELEFLLRMQVPAGQQLAGMAHHKVGDATWTGLPMDPAADSQQRVLSPPSTAATLNLAAAAAQGARLFKPYDKTFADRLLTAARAAWTAAEANPSRFAPESDGLGSGAYGDTDVSDERYWAAAELYLTTGDADYAGAVTASPWHTGEVFKPEGFDWQHTAALGRLDLATVPSGLSDRDRVRRSVVDGARKYLATQQSSAYGLPYAPASGKFDWGSNGLVLNIMAVMATGADISGDKQLRDGVLDGLGYVLGRNALDQSYVTGYGYRASSHQHSRWYAHQLDAKLPPPPPGTLAGGPNSSIQDPVAAQSLQGCKPQLCYRDDIMSWSTNELTINWNSALAWVAAYAAGKAEPQSP